MQKLPKISIVIPSYNKVKYIRETLQSIVNQKYPDLEVIIMDGGSTDGTLDVIKKYAKKYPKLFFVESKKDKGQTDAINKGFKKATGDIFCFINADDVYEDKALLIVGEYFAKHPDTLWLAGRGRVIDAKGQEIAQPITWYKNLLLSINHYPFLLTTNYLMQPSVFVSRRGFEKYGPYIGGKYVMEYELWLKLAKRGIPKVLNRTLSSFRLEESSASSTQFNKILSKDYEIVKKYTKNPLILFAHHIHNFVRKAIVGESYFLPLVIIFSYLTLFLDTIKYPGFVSSHFLIDAKVYFALAITLILFYRNISKLLALLLKINIFIFGTLLVSYVGFSIVEGSHWANYVLSQYHFNLEGLANLLLFSSSLFFYQLVKIPVINRKNLGFVVLVFLLFYTFVVNVGSVFKTASVSNVYVAFHLNDTYDEKMTHSWGNFYHFMIFVKNNTPENASIILPPTVAPWWVRIANAGLVRYFLYPRNLVQYGKEEIPDLHNLPKDTYIVIVWAESGCTPEGICRNWPRQKIEASEVIFKNSDSVDVKEARVNFLYNPNDTSNPFGLLKI